MSTSLSKDAFIRAARVPGLFAAKPRQHGLWIIGKQKKDQCCGVEALEKRFGPFDDMTLLGRFTEAKLHQPFGDIVMEDSYAELETHWPIWREAEGRVLVTGLGLGCVVRGLLLNPAVKSIDCIEIDPWIFETVGKEFRSNERVALHLGDALKFKPTKSWDFAWHDIYTEKGNGLPLARLHVKLMLKTFKKCVGKQGAWNFPEAVSKQYGLLHGVA